MNSTQAHEPEVQAHEPEVTVELSECSAQDAHTVFSALRTSFGCDRRPNEVPHEAHATRPTVWNATFDVCEPGAAGKLGAVAEPAELSGPVVANIQGGYHAVDRMRDTLGAVFAVEVVGKVSGDQETEIQLRLTTK
ncbi:hypothetical protein H1V43_05165 [Streptomyces sp. PSKA54]|uniref:Uncharacterized protein n=1 Tax=Streptomyces himalayensis subsp. aureolus TaxID=2758039 RepID=A0A7W2CX97_9ACTN|nr:hypothetical protein [Streptomyces himalayensis]MBA4860778.1 hypothetical protein [Streptomyces himalayensis subsp. aureolus]